MHVAFIYLFLSWNNRLSSKSQFVPTRKDTNLGCGLLQAKRCPTECWNSKNEMKDKTSTPKYIPLLINHVPAHAPKQTKDTDESIFSANCQVKRRKILHIAVVVAKLYFQAASGICSTKKEFKKHRICCRRTCRSFIFFEHSDSLAFNDSN